MPNIFGIVQRMSHHIHNFTHKCYFFAPFPLSVIVAQRVFTSFFRKHFDSVKPQALFYYMCFLLYFISVIRWPVAALDSLLSCVCALFSHSIFRCVHMVNIFMFRLNFAHWPKSCTFTTTKHIFSYTQNCWSSSFPKNGTPKVCDMCLIMNANEYSHSFSHTHRERERHIAEYMLFAQVLYTFTDNSNGNGNDIGKNDI